MKARLKRHHRVPDSYLKGWADETGRRAVRRRDRSKAFPRGGKVPITTANATPEEPQPPAAARRTDTYRADLMTLGGQFSGPPPGSFVAVFGQFLVAAVCSTPATRGGGGEPSVTNGVRHTLAGTPVGL